MRDNVRPMPIIRYLYRYPVKGLSAQKLEAVELRAGEAIAWDRAYAIENGPGRFDPANPRHLPKINFLMLMRHEKLAALKTEFDPDTQILTVYRDGKQVARGALDTRLGRQMIEQFLAGYLKEELKGPPKIVSAPGHTFSDMAEKCLHLVNLETVRELEGVLHAHLDPLRFRANIYFEGLEPWREFDWLNREIVAGSARLRVFARTSRCDATNVDPQTAQRDTAIPPEMLRIYGHDDVGVYATVIHDGCVRVGDSIGPDGEI